MANRLRGEISAVLDGRKWTLVLTLGALAELEDAFACEDLQALVERFASGRLSATDLIKVLGAGLRGAGNDVSDDQLAVMTATGGAAGYAAIASDLLKATFSDNNEADEPNGRMPETDGDQEARLDASAPFPGSAYSISP